MIDFEEHRRPEGSIDLLEAWRANWRRYVRVGHESNRVHSFINEVEHACPVTDPQTAALTFAVIADLVRR